MDINELKSVSPISYKLFRLFSLLQKYSLSNYLFRSRPDVQNQKDIDEKKIISIRGPQIERYILIWMVFEFIMLFVARHLFVVGQIVGVVLILYRLIEMFQTTVNIALFDRLQISNKQYRVASHLRMIILTFLNYFELSISFAVLYSIPFFPIDSFNDWIDPFYYSVVTQLTIGFGDIKPLGLSKYLVVSQGFLSFLITVLAISRLISYLPRIHSIIDDEHSV